MSKDRTATRFEAPGSIPKPGVIGRLVRLSFGLVLLWALYGLLVVGWDIFVGTTLPTDWSWWVLIGAALWWTPYVVNIGFTRGWRRRPQYAIVGAIIILVGLDLVVYRAWWAPPLGAFVWLWLLYFSAHLGVSFFLSAVIRTPGCEMRSIPHFWTLLTGRETAEHYCPGVLDRIDRWERQRSS